MSSLHQAKLADGFLREPCLPAQFRDVTAKVVELRDELAKPPLRLLRRRLTAARLLPLSLGAQAVHRTSGRGPSLAWVPERKETSTRPMGNRVSAKYQA